MAKEGKQDTSEPSLLESMGVKHDQGKLDWTLMPSWKALEDVIRVMEHGAEKYSRDGWVKVSHQRYKAALMRHVVDYMQGVTIDHDSHLPTLAHIICNAMFLYHKDRNGEKKD